MSEQDPLSTSSLWAKQAAILEEPSDYTTKLNGTNEKENMDERSRRNPGRDDSGYGVKPRQDVKQVPRRTRIVSSSDTDDAIMNADEGTQTALGDTPPHSKYNGQDDEYASTSRKLARASLERNGQAGVKSAIKVAKNVRDIQPPAEPNGSQNAEKLGKQSWSKRALARTKDILSITAKEPSTYAFEDYRNKEFKRAGVKTGDNAAAKLHVSSQKLPPEAPKVQSKEPPPITRNTTDANTTANKSVGRFSSSRVKTTAGNFGGRGKSSSAHSLASSGSRDSSVLLGSARVSFQGSASGSGSVGGSEMGQGPVPGPGRLIHSQTDGSTRMGTAMSAGRGITPTKLNGKQKAAAIDDRW